MADMEKRLGRGPPGDMARIFEVPKNTTEYGTQNQEGLMSAGLPGGGA